MDTFIAASVVGFQILWMVVLIAIARSRAREIALVPVVLEDCEGARATEDGCRSIASAVMAVVVRVVGVCGCVDGGGGVESVATADTEAVFDLIGEPSLYSGHGSWTLFSMRSSSKRHVASLLYCFVMTFDASLSCSESRTC